MSTRRVLLLTLVGSLMAAPAGTAAQSADSVALNRAAVEWIHLLRDGHFDSAAARVDPAAAAQLGAQQLAAVWQSVGAQLGELKSLGPGPVIQAGVYRVVDLEGKFANAVVTVRVTFDARERISGLFFRPRSAAPAWSAPAYVDPTAFREVDVTVGTAPWTLPGTLTLPTGPGPFPAVALVHGSGPNDRDESVGPNRPFKDLAWGLATRGIAVLRYDKRTKVYGDRMDADIDLDTEVIDDALAALALVRSRPEVDTDQVVLVGHSLGGMLAPEIARRDGHLAGVVLLAAPARRFTVVLREQLEYGASLAPDDDATRTSIAGLLALLDAFEAGTMSDTVAILGARRAYLQDLDAVHPVSTLRALDLPALVLQGGRDYQSTLVDLDLWKTALAERPRTTVRAYPSLNHLFAPGSGKATPNEYATVPNHVDEAVVTDLASWVRALHPAEGELHRPRMAKE